jgi:glycosyltransferase involved in cell wall biosynthesis
VIVVTERLPFTTIALAKHFPIVLDVVDSMTLHMGERAARGSPLLSWFWKSEATRFARLAPTLSKVAKVILAASATAATEYPGVIVIPNAASLQSRPRPAPQYDLIFTGNLWYWPNVEAARIVCELIVPLVRQRLPGVRVLIAGRNPKASVRHFARKAGVTLMANVPDLGELLASSRVALAPIKWTPGANLKILDALAVGTPVLTFEMAASQLPAPTNGVVTCDSAEDMARVATELLLGERDPVLPTESNDWKDRADRLTGILNQLASDQSREAHQSSPL